MIDVEKLIDTFDFTGEQHIGSRLAPFCIELAGQLADKARQKAAKNNRGHKTYGEHIATAVVELNAVADALRKHAAAPDPNVPIVCGAVNQLGAICMRTEAGHTSHTFPPTEPVQPESSAAPVCGIEDRYTTHEAGKSGPDRCTRPPHGRDTAHEGAWSKWPWQDEQGSEFHPYASTPPSAEIVHEIKQPNPATIAYLKGETDELGTEPMIIADGPAGTPTVQKFGPNPATASYVETGLSERVGIGPTMGPPTTALLGKPLSEVLTVQPDPFDNALPEDVHRTATWRPEPDPRPLWLPGWAHDTWPDAPPSVRTTHVRVGEECGLAYRLLSRDKVPEVPAWWNVGGSALHECARWFEMRIIEGMGTYALTDEASRSMWAEQFAGQIAALEAETPFGRSQWRAANKGTEGEDWWNEVGPLMVRDYSAASAQWHADGWAILTVPKGPAMELEMRMPIMGMAHGGELTGHLDQAWFRLDEGDTWEIRIRDLKSGRTLPCDTWQTESYTLLLRTMLAGGLDGAPLVGGLDRVRFSAVFYDARNGKDGEVIDLTTQNVPEIHYRAGSVLRMHETNNYPANPRDGYGGPCYLCPVRYACPIMALKS